MFELVWLWGGGINKFCITLNNTEHYFKESLKKRNLKLSSPASKMAGGADQGHSSWWIADQTVIMNG